MEGKVIYLTNVDRRFFMMRKACSELKREGLVPAEYETLKVESTSLWSRIWEKQLGDADLVMIRFMGTTIRTMFWDKCLAFFAAKSIPYYMDAAGSAEEEARNGVSEADVEKIKQYSFYSGIKNYKNLWLFLQFITNKGGEMPAEPSAYCWTGIYHPGLPELCTTDLRSYKKMFCREDCPTVGMIFYRDEWIWGDLQYQNTFIRECERQGMNAIAVFTNGLPISEMGMPTLSQVFHNYFMADGKPAVDVIVNILKFSFTASGSITKEELKEISIPVLEGYSLIMPEQEWAKSKEGMNPVEISISVSMPEFDGIIHGVPVAAKHMKENGEVEYLPISERMAFMVSKAKKWALLRSKENKDKKIAIIFHNYPPTNASIGSAVGLDSIESIRLLLQRMKKEGYRVDFIPEDTESFIKTLTAHATNDISMLTDKQVEECNKNFSKAYIDFFATFSESVKRQMEKDWEEAPGKVMLDDYKNLLVPGIMDGNIFITVQAPRSYGMDPAKIYHDPYVAPTHQYISFYQWIRDEWKADAVIHVGTHGNLEWLPGKGAGLDRKSYPDLSLGDLPNIYPYHMTITGEGIQAKRRSAACLVDHLPAPLAEAGVYDELAELEKMMDEYAHFMQIQPENAGSLEPMIRELAEKAELDGEIPYDENKPFLEYVGKLHQYLEELKNGEVHVGLHILGQAPQGEILIDEILQFLRLDNGEIPSIYEIWAEKYDTTVDEIIGNAGKLHPRFQITYSELMSRIRNETKNIIKILEAYDFSDEGIEKALLETCIFEENESWKKKLTGILSYICHDLIQRLWKTAEEMDHIMDGLSSRYILPGLSGSPHTGGVNLLPSGRNFFGLDPRTLPTKAAWELGKRLGDQVIEQYIADEGKYPENIGMVFWSGSNMRSHGQCIAEFLYFMGIKPVWEKGSLQVKRLEVIPLSELMRPRIDVTARISGLFRDTMPTVVELLDKAVLLAADLNELEDDNYIKKHISEESSLMEKSGMTHEESWRNAAYRIFGDAPGTYGAGVSALLESKNWQTVDDLADVFVRWGGHAYGGAVKGEYSPELFRKRLSVMDATVKNEDNHETNMLSSDDYNAYHGGMIAAVRSIRGSAPHSYAGDSADRLRPKVRTVQEEAKRIFRMESINPKYIDGMMNHGYKGASDMSKMVSVSFQWDATSEVMEDWMYEKYAEKYALDEKVQDWMKRVNPWALQRITETLLEAEARGLWNAKEKTMKELKNLYLSIEGELEGEGDDNV